MRKEHCALHAYVLMTNHVHLLLTPQHGETVPRLVFAFGRRFVQYINTVCRRTGTRTAARKQAEGRAARRKRSRERQLAGQGELEL